jgi:DNA-binding NarL/FixJ family response regulator
MINPMPTPHDLRRRIANLEQRLSAAKHQLAKLEAGERDVTDDGILSDRELDVLKRLTFGFGPSQISRSLDVSEKTVETYKARGCEKLGVRSRYELVRHAVLMGWFDDMELAGN